MSELALYSEQNETPIIPHMDGRCSVNASVPEVNDSDVSGAKSVVMAQPL